MRFDACRVCQCTEERACAGGCEWVRVERPSIRAEGVPPLCSACAGSHADLCETLARISKLYRQVPEVARYQVAAQADRMARAAIKRVRDAVPF